VAQDHAAKAQVGLQVEQPAGIAVADGAPSPMVRDQNGMICM
jgi:hypothetical protein